MNGQEIVGAVLAALSDPAMLLDRNGRVASVNDAARDRFGGWIGGRSYVSVLRQPSLLKPIETAFFTGRSTTARFRHTTGEIETVFDATIRPLRDLTRDLRPPVLLVFRDVSDREHGSAMRQEFVANVSHELKTPLTALMGFAETLQGPARNDPAARSRFLDLMTQELARMDRLVVDLLSLERAETRMHVRPKERIDLVLPLMEAVELLRTTASESDVDLQSDVPAEAFALAERDQIVQLGVNLLENAVKYGTRPGAVRLSLVWVEREPRMHGSAWRLLVQDNGRGIEPHHIPRLTERFYRADLARSPEQGGTGLGLAIVKHIVNRHRGRLRIESNLGQGTSVTVLLPAFEEG